MEFVIFAKPIISKSFFASSNFVSVGLTTLLSSPWLSLSLSLNHCLFAQHDAFPLCQWCSLHHLWPFATIASPTGNKPCSDIAVAFYLARTTRVSTKGVSMIRAIFDNSLANYCITCPTNQGALAFSWIPLLWQPLLAFGPF